MDLLKRLLPPVVLLGTAVWLWRARGRPHPVASAVTVTPAREVPWGE